MITVEIGTDFFAVAFGSFGLENAGNDSLALIRLFACTNNLDRDKDIKKTCYPSRRSHVLCNFYKLKGTHNAFMSMLDMCPIVT